MLVVALTAIGIQVTRWGWLSWEYYRRSRSLYGASIERWPASGSDGSRALVRRRRQWAGTLAEKDDQAARHPWLPIEPDPPEPE